MLDLAGVVFRRVDHFFRCELWTKSLYDRWHRPHERLSVHVLRCAYLIVRAVFFRDQLRLHASALTFMTMLTLVPALAVIFSLFTAFGGLDDAKDRLRYFLIDLLAGSQREKILAWLEETVGGVHAGALGGVSLLLLLLTAIGLLGDIEQAFNAIWGVKKERSILRRFQRYWPVLTIGPPLIGVSLSLTASVEASPMVSGLVDRIPFLGELISLSSALFTTIGFVVAYAAIPNTKVKLSSAIVGGLAGGMLWEIAKRLYALYAKEAITYSAIYGSLAFVPLTVIWIYISWLLVLAGAIVAFAFQNARTFQPESVGQVLPARQRDRIAATLLLAVYQRFSKARGGTAEEALTERVPGPPRATREVLTELLESELLQAAVSKQNGEPIYLPAQPAEQLTLGDLHRLFHGDPEAPKTETEEASRVVSNPALEALDRAEQASIAELDTITMADLLSDDGSPKKRAHAKRSHEPPEIRH
jgi:membrane protein